MPSTISHMMSSGSKRRVMWSNKKGGMRASDMTPSVWLYRQLKRFRAGVEAGISHLKRCFGLGLCRWHGLPRFKAYVQSAVFAHNLMRLARLRPQPG